MDLLSPSRAPATKAGMKVWRRSACEGRFGRISGPLSSCCRPQAALKLSYRSDRMTRNQPVALRVRAAKSGTRVWAARRRDDGVVAQAVLPVAAADRLTGLEVVDGEVFQHGLPRESGVLNIRGVGGAGGSGSRSGARQCESR